MSSLLQSSRRNSMDVPPKMQSCRDATLTSPGPPALYRLNTERKLIDGNQKKVRRWTYGQKDRNKQSKVILLVGETGAGKTTLLNTMINCFLGVKFEDEEWYEITEEEEEENIEDSITQTAEITVYEVFVEEKPTSLTIIDTPGYGHTEGYERDREIAESLIRLFSHADGIHYIDAVCFVMKASQNRLSDKELYVFHSILSLFGQDLENNIVFLITHSDERCPTNVLRVIKKAQIPCKRDVKKQPVHFSFNNQQKDKRDERYNIYRLSWETGERSVNELLTLLEEKKRKSVQMTLNVLKERRQLEACVFHLKKQISDAEETQKGLTEIQETLRQNQDKIIKCEDFQFTVETSVKEKVSTENEWWWNRKPTCCNVCEENCHEWSCGVHDPSSCEVMKKDHCTKCTGKCHYSKHVRENKKYQLMKKTVIMTFTELKHNYERIGDKPKTIFDKKIYANITQEHERNVKESENKSETEEKLKSHLEEIRNEESKLLHEAFTAIVSLSDIALKADSAFTLQHLDYLIPRLKEEGKDERVNILEDLRRAGEERRNKGALRHVKDFTGKTLKQYDNRVAASKHHHRRKSLDELPEIIPGVIRLKDEFTELYERDRPELQQCTERLRQTPETFQHLCRRSAEGSREAAQMGMIGAAVMIAGIASASFSLGAFLSVLTVGGVLILACAGFISRMSSSDKKRQMTQLRKDIEAALEEFQDKINPMTKKLQEILERSEKILREQDVVWMDDIGEWTAQMSETALAIESISTPYGVFGPVIDLLSVSKNTRVLADIRNLAETATHEETDEREMKTKDGKFIVKMRKLINQLQNIVDGLEKTKDQLAVY